MSDLAIIACGLGLTRTQAAVVARLAKTPHPVHSECLFAAVWGQERPEVEITNLGVMIHQVRRKLGADFILNKYGIGFYLSDRARSAVATLPSPAITHQSGKADQ